MLTAVVCLFIQVLYKALTRSKSQCTNSLTMWDFSCTHLWTFRICACKTLPFLRKWFQPVVCALTNRMHTVNLLLNLVDSTSSPVTYPTIISSMTFIKAVCTSTSFVRLTDCAAAVFLVLDILRFKEIIYSCGGFTFIQPYCQTLFFVSSSTVYGYCLRSCFRLFVLFPHHELITNLLHLCVASWCI